MFTQCVTKGAICLVLWTLLTNISTSPAVAINSSSGRHSCHSAEKNLLAILGLNEDVNDTEIIKLLEVPVQRIYATALIRYRKISSATPRLVQTVNGDTTSIFAKLVAAEALCDFGNREWVETIKALSTDPNSRLHIPLKIEVAGLLARAGDYSQFEVAANHIDDTKWSVRYVAIRALGNFGHATDPVTDLATELLTFIASSDPVPWLRDVAIGSLEKIAKIKAEVTLKVIDVLKANSDSPDKNLSMICRAKLKMYGQE